MSNLEELSDELIKIISSGNDEKFDAAADFLKQHKEKATYIINTLGTKSKKTPLMIACRNSEENIVKLLLTYGPDPNVQCNYGKTAVLYSIGKYSQESDFNIIRMLAEYGADLNVMHNDVSPLTFAIQNSISNLNSPDSDSMRYKLIELLLQLGADVNKRNGEKDTPLIFAAKYEKELIPLLIKYGANVDDKDWFGRTPLMISLLSNSNSIEMANELLDAKANVFVEDKNWKSTIDYLENVFVDTSRLIIPLKILMKLIPKVVKAYLEPLASYFRDSSFDKIQNDISEFLKNPNNLEIFPINRHHLSAIRRLNSILSDKLDSLYLVDLFKEFAKDHDFIFYFSSVDFQEKLYADVINRIDEDQAEIDGQTLREMRARVRNEEDLCKVNEIADVLKEKSNLATNFLNESK